jgi:hypothetical protein
MNENFLRWFEARDTGLLSRSSPQESALAISIFTSTSATNDVLEELLLDICSSVSGTGLQNVELSLNLDEVLPLRMTHSQQDKKRRLSQSDGYPTNISEALEFITDMQLVADEIEHRSPPVPKSSHSQLQCVVPAQQTVDIDIIGTSHAAQAPTALPNKFQSAKDQYKSQVLVFRTAIISLSFFIVISRYVS